MYVHTSSQVLAQFHSHLHFGIGENSSGGLRMSFNIYLLGKSAILQNRCIYIYGSWNQIDIYSFLCNPNITMGATEYRQVSNIIRTLVGNYIVYHSDVVGASPVGATPTTSSFST